ncbi:unconventional myosin-XVIIIa [Halyomorpha halys]|uniref:unconventional myosin-XVIIIa n=1 Tax=Halyomorpha halys TaxID=286706 RepID=UPI0034D18230
MVPEGQTENEKSIIDWIRYFVAFAFLLPCFFVVVVFLKYEGTWSMWLSLFFSRGIYIILATLIFGCFIITFFKKKVQEGSRGESKNEEAWCISQELWKPPYLPSCHELTSLGRKPFHMEDGCDSDAVKQMLREADTRNEALKRELEELNKTRIALEERSGALEREKTKVEERLEEAKYQSALDSENLRKEAAITQRQLQQVIEGNNEKEMLTREVSSASRESRITESALKDQARLTTRLEEARDELNRLKLQMEEMKMERDTAVAIAADLAVRAQGAADDSAQLIGQWVRREMENRRKKETPSATALETTDLEGDFEVSETNDIDQENTQNEKIEMFKESTETDLEAGNNNVFLNSMPEVMHQHSAHCDMHHSHGEPIIKAGKNAFLTSMPEEMHQHSAPCDMHHSHGEHIINWESEEQEYCMQSIGCGPVTSSAAFRDFLTAHYS